MTHIFIEEESKGYAVKFGDLVVHVSDYDQAMQMAVKMAQTLGLIGEQEKEIWFSMLTMDLFADGIS